MSATGKDAAAFVYERLDETLFVEAGAGTGKTTALVGRIIRLVLGGRSPLGNIAAITFTEAAAAELRDRISESFERIASGELTAAPISDLVAEIGESAIIERADAARAEVDGAAISTLHSFARRLLSEHPFEAGLPPIIEVSDELRSSVAFDERWDEFLDWLLSEPEYETTLMRGFALGLGLDLLKQLAAKFNDNWDLISEYRFGQVPDPPISIDAVVDPLEEANGLMGHCSDADDILLKHLQGLIPWRDRLIARDDDLDRIGVLLGGKLKCRNGKKDVWAGRVDDVRALTYQADAAREQLLATVGDAVVRRLLIALTRFTLDGAEMRRREGRLEYHDLLVWARRLVRTRPDALAAIRSQYRYLLIDEFQDTDPIQAELAVRIATQDPDAGSRSWRDLGVEEGRLFFVGDPKQSIYRFRRADLTVFLGVRDTLGARHVLFDKNRRSVPGVIDWVNMVFAELIGEGQGADQPRYESLEAVRPAQGALGGLAPVVLLGGAAEPGELTTAVRMDEAEEVVSAIRQVVAEAWPVADGQRPAKLSDVTILIPSRTGLPILQEALEEGEIAYRLETSSLVYSSQEVRDLLSVLAAIDDPTDHVSIVAALRSPLYGCGDDDLLAYRLDGGRFDYRLDPPETIDPAHPVRAGLASLDALHEEAIWVEVSTLIEKVLTERHVLELALDDRRPRDAWRRLRFVADQARQFAEAFGGSLRHYLTWAARQTDEDIRVTEPVLPENDNEAVRIMTVHAAKGLEFPIVILTGLNTMWRGRPGPQVLFDPDAPAVRIAAALQTVGFDAGRARDKELDDLERLRLLYVAATRAMDHLIVSVHHKEKDQTSHAALVERCCAAFPDLWRTLEDRPATSTDDDAVDLELVSKGTPADPAAARAQWSTQRAERLAAAKPRTIAATGVAKLGQAQDATRDELADALELAHVDADDKPGWQRGRAGTAIGRAVHGTLQSVDLATGARLEELARAQAVGEGVAGEAAHIARLALAALQAPIVRAAVESGAYWRELYVGVPVGERVLEGFIDLLVRTDEGLVVVDYKTDQLRAEEDLDAAVDRYRLQGAAYAVAIEASLGQSVRGCTFLFLSPSGAIERSIEDLEAAKDRVRALLGAAA